MESLYEPPVDPQSLVPPPCLAGVHDRLAKGFRARSFASMTLLNLTLTSVPFRKFEEEVLRTLRGLRPHPLPLALDPERTRGALRREAAADTAVSGGMALRSPALRCAQRGASVATGGSARGGSQGGGGPSAPRLLHNLTPPPARLPPGNAHTRRGRGLGFGWGWRTTTAVRHAPVERP